MFAPGGEKVFETVSTLRRVKLEGYYNEGEVGQLLKPPKRKKPLSRFTFVAPEADRSAVGQGRTAGALPESRTLRVARIAHGLPGTRTRAREVSQMLRICENGVIHAAQMHALENARRKLPRDHQRIRPTVAPVQLPPIDETWTKVVREVVLNGPPRPNAEKNRPTVASFRAPP
jgi:hypothetical protein